MNTYSSADSHSLLIDSMVSVKREEKVLANSKKGRVLEI